MDDALCMRRVQSIRALDGVFQQRLKLKRLILNGAIELPPLQQLHHDEMTAIHFTDVVDGANIRVIESRGRTRFSLKPFQRLRVFLHSLWQEFQRDTPAKARVLRLIDDAHAARAQLVRDLVMEKKLAYHRGGILPAKPVFRVLRAFRVFLGQGLRDTVLHVSPHRLVLRPHRDTESSDQPSVRDH